MYAFIGCLMTPLLTPHLAKNVFMIMRVAKCKWQELTCLVGGCRLATVLQVHCVPCTFYIYMYMYVPTPTHLDPAGSCWLCPMPLLHFNLLG